MGMYTKPEHKRKLRIIAAACQRLREDNNLSMSQMGKRSGYAKETIWGFENGINNNACILASYLDLVVEGGILEWLEKR